MTMEKPLVSVRMITYNQEKYIAEAIESVLMQKVNFRYELIIGEDASTDRTASIVDSYQQKKPDIIKVFHRQKNLGMKMNNRLVMQECSGKYVAVIAGDDFWTYDGKLQKQVDYLEKNLDVIATAHNVYSWDKDGNEVDADYRTYPIQKGHIYNKRHAMCLKRLGHSSSFVYRNIKYILDEEQWETFLYCKLYGDLKLPYTLGMLGKVVYFDDIWSCSRRLFEGDGWLAKTYQKNLFYVLFDFDLEACKYFKTMFGVDIDISERLLDKYNKANMLAVKSPTKENISVAMKINISYAIFLLKRELNKYAKKIQHGGAQHESV